MKKIFTAIITIGLLHSLVFAQPSLEVTKRVANYIIRNTPFQYQFDLFKASSQLSDLQQINFERNFGSEKNTIAFAFTNLFVEKDTSILLELSHSGSLEIIVNDKNVYQAIKPTTLECKFLERNIELGEKIKIDLRSGNNNVIFKSVCTNSDDWKVLFQCSNSNIKINLENLKTLNESVKTFSNFIITGGFIVNNTTAAFTKIFDAETNIEFTKVYQYKNKKYTWTLPKFELTQTLINPQTYWGAYYNYNYHAAGVAWAIAELAKVTADTIYNNYSNNYCNFILQSKPFIDFQVNELWQVNSIDHLMVNTPLLDFTSAPAMPFLYRLINEPAFKERKDYATFFQQIKQYIFTKQNRSPGGNFARITPEKYTTWVDDMFMGLPFVIHCAEETKDSAEKKMYQDDAAKQVLSFAAVLFDKKDSLFHHASHSTRPEILYPYWLRANGWGIWAITEVLKGLPTNHPSYNKILSLYKAHINALVKLQDKSGLWHNIVNIPTSKLETSGSAIITLVIARGVNEHWLDKKTYAPIAQKGWNALCKEIEPDGQVNNIIVGSFTNEDYHYYERQPFVKNDSHGMFCVIMCGLEMAKLKR